jgi:hypothetical protein
MMQHQITTGLGNFIDFAAYRMAVERWHHGAALYGREPVGVMSQLGLDHVWDYLYPPAVLLYATLFRPLPYDIAAQLWGIAGVLAFWGALVLLLEQYCSLSWVKRAALFPVVFAFQPVWYGFTLGQITALLAALVTLSAVAMERAHRGHDGALVGLGVTAAAFVKPTIAPAGAVLLSSRRRLAGATLTAAVLYGIGIGVFGLGPHLEYIDVLLRGKPGQPVSLNPVATFHRGWWEPFDILGILSWIPRLLILAMVAVLALLRDDSRSADRGAFAAGCVAVPLAAPEAYALSFMFIIPTLVVLGAERPRWRPALVLGLLALHWHIWVLLGIISIAPIDELAYITQPGLYASLALLAASVWILQENQARTLDELITWTPASGFGH